MYAADFRKIARDSLRGRWLVAIITTLVAGLVGATASGFRITLNINDIEDFELVFDVYTLEILKYVAAYMKVASVLGIISFVLGGVLQLGYSIFCLNMVDGNKAGFRDMFSLLHRFGDGFCLRLLTGIFIFLRT